MATGDPRCRARAGRSWAGEAEASVSPWGCASTLAVVAEGEERRGWKEGSSLENFPGYWSCQETEVVGRTWFVRKEVSHCFSLKTRESSARVLVAIFGMVALFLFPAKTALLLELSIPKFESIVKWHCSTFWADSLHPQAAPRHVLFPDMNTIFDVGTVT